MFRYYRIRRHFMIIRQRAYLLYAIILTNIISLRVLCIFPDISSDKSELIYNNTTLVLLLTSYLLTRCVYVIFDFYSNVSRVIWLVGVKQLRLPKRRGFIHSRKTRYCFNQSSASFTVRFYLSKFDVLFVLSRFSFPTVNMGVWGWN